jgi:hypothetical protein
MKKQLFSSPEAFSLLPLLSLLPVHGKVAKLKDLTTSLFARYEKVHSMQREITTSTDNDRELSRRLAVEEAMLRQVLDWLEVKPESNRFAGGNE